MGNYGFPIERVEPKDRFPHGLKAIGDAVEKAGLGFLVWFEPERVARARSCQGASRSGSCRRRHGSGLYNLGIPAARQYMTDYLNAVIRAYKLSCLRIDYNIDPLPIWQSWTPRTRTAWAWPRLRYVEGLYRMWDDIRKANPNLFIDNCASGGRRIDLETMSRSIPLWRSDNTCDMVGAQAGHHLAGGDQEPGDERRPEPLRALQHRGPDGRDALFLPQRLQRRHRLLRRTCGPRTILASC